MKSNRKTQKQLKQLNSIFGLNKEDLDRFGKDLFRVALETNATFESTAFAAEQFARTGLNLNETIKRTKDALALSRASGLSIVLAINSLTTAINSFNSNISSTKILRKFGGNK